MRLMFWSARDVGLDKHQTFFKWFTDFIGHFIGLYEHSSGAYVMDSAEWSENQANIAKYVKDGYKMVDVIGIGREV
jgi:hypothetical protein